MSFAHTKQQIRNRTKDVTRRLGWLNVRVGERIAACDKTMGLKKGERSEILSEIRVTYVNREQLNIITKREVEREGFPDMTPDEFVTMFCGHMKCKSNAIITRIAFEYIDARVQ